MEESSELVPKQIEFKDVLSFFNSKSLPSFQIFNYFDYNLQSICTFGLYLFPLKLSLIWFLILRPWCLRTEAIQAFCADGHPP